ncbi:MAG TPA: Asp-tRNA(Asn)/Glu-tRNA(Gln) amidotransferase subunit GatC [Candidatus Limnocylindrales bacterium]|nr:Asp-tRNA(Asn)/Glu-tRNA(Gln) amidotransferase subunit GatC [Candidatus Limnocylindrales bacterium]
MDSAELALARAIKAIKLEIDEQEREQLLGELNSFLHWLEPLLMVDTAEVKPVLVNHGAVNVMRDDRAQPGELTALRKATTNFDEGFYQVPTILE